MSHMAGRRARSAFMGSILARPQMPPDRGWRVLGACLAEDAPATPAPDMRLVRNDALALAVLPAELTPPEVLPGGLARFEPAPVVKNLREVARRLHRTAPQLADALQARHRQLEVRVVLLGRTGAGAGHTPPGIESRIAAWLAQASAEHASCLCRTPGPVGTRPDRYAWLALSLLVEPDRLPELRALVGRAREMLAGTGLSLVVSGPGEGRRFPLTEWAA